MYVDTEIDGDLTGCTPGGSDLTVDYEFDFAVQYYADATDASSDPDYSTDTWTAYVAVTDDNSGSDSDSATTTEMNTLLAIDVTSSVDYGTIALGASNGTAKTVTVTNTGNENSLDATIEQASTWTCTVGTIAQSAVDWNLTDGGAGAGTTVSATPANLSMSINKYGGTATDDVYLYLTLPSTGVGGTCTSTLTFTADAG